MSSLSPYLFELTIDVMGHGIVDPFTWCVLFRRSAEVCEMSRKVQESRLTGFEAYVGKGAMEVEVEEREEGADREGDGCTA